MGVFKKNGNWWIDYYDSNGKRHRKKIGTQKTIADTALKDVQVKIDKGEYLGIYEEKKIYFKDFASIYIEKYAYANLKGRTFNRCKGIIENNLIPFFDCYLTKINKEKIEKYKT